MDRELFIKYLQNRCSPEELERVIEWFNNEAGMISGRAFLYKFWEEIRDEEKDLDESSSKLLHRIHYDINRKESEKLINESNDNPVGYRKRRRIFQSLIRIAAVLFIPLFIATLYISNNQISFELPGAKEKEPVYTSVYSPVGSISQVDLPDGTKAWLNHNTTLVYPQNFSNNSRYVSLTGEAYFKVKHDPDNPFVVQTDELNIVATGTEFNVMAFPESERVETTLASGKVLLQKKTPEGSSKTVLEMIPNEHAVYDATTNKLVYGYENIDKYILWKEGRIVFQNDPLDRVAERLSRFYNVDFIVEDSILGDYTYTATFVDETLPQVMELLEIATPIEYTITSRKKKDDGSFTKRKVIIKYRGK